MDPSRHPDDESEPREPRTEGEVGGLAPVQLALALLVFFLGLLALWVIWPLISGS